MDQPFSKQLCELADNMGIALYQRFTQVEASLFLRCPLVELENLQKKRKIEFIQITNNQTEFFGYQLIDYVLTNIKEKSSPTGQPSTSERILCSKEVQELTGLSRTTIWRLERSGKFPARIPLCSTRIGWRYTEIQTWLSKLK
ncbi:AlpA family phage regulatory protein [Pseudoalteromonas sp. C2R02]|uniref:helix-turn-helix transcriptional regulator n=1 Tax=Pseudoalteromonas sp. C2R02 TaxID=2841565 RepID=UPI001C0A0011|nr:AlpA family phage regulatory protein [Pseudoalteromonas sp. C2R02]MBU2969839.1 AlpA family phage regulatory protein [Pseudoalteromonas sp. C2R02]